MHLLGMGETKMNPYFISAMMETSLGLKRVCLKCNRSQVVSHDVKQHTPRCKFLVRTYRFVSCWPRKGWFWLESRSHDHPTWQRKRITKEKAKKIGIKAFVMKPLVMRNLAETVRKVLDEKWYGKFTYLAAIPAHNVPKIIFSIYVKTSDFFAICCRK